MAMAAAMASGILGGATTKFTRTAARKAMHGRSGAPRLPRTAQNGHGLLMMLAWAAAAGVILAIGDVLLEQRRRSVDTPADVDTARA